MNFLGNRGWFRSFIKLMSFSLWAFWIVLDEDNRVLLALRNDIDMWNLPWWWVEEWEAPWDAVIREIKEETWLDSSIISLVWLYNKKDEKDLVFLFHCNKIWWKLSLNGEAKSFWWFEIDKLPENVIDLHKERILDFFWEREWLILREKFWEKKFIWFK